MNEFIMNYHLMATNALRNSNEMVTLQVAAKQAINKSVVKRVGSEAHLLESKKC